MFSISSMLATPLPSFDRGETYVHPRLECKQRGNASESASVVKGRTLN
jgi:hypothetical protein